MPAQARVEVQVHVALAALRVVQPVAEHLELPRSRLISAFSVSIWFISSMTLRFCWGAGC